MAGIGRKEIVGVVPSFMVELLLAVEARYLRLAGFNAADDQRDCEPQKDVWACGSICFVWLLDDYLRFTSGHTWSVECDKDVYGVRVHLCLRSCAENQNACMLCVHGPDASCVCNFRARSL